MQPYKTLFNTGTNMPHYGNEPYGLKGIGPAHTPIAVMDSFVDTTLNKELHFETCIGLAKVKDFGVGMFPGSISKIDSKKINGQKNWTEIMANMGVYDPTGVHQEAIDQLIHYSKETGDVLLKLVYKYCYFAMDSAIPWMFTVYLRNSAFLKKTEDKDNLWTSNIRHFPNIRKFVETLPFKTIGRVLFFTTYPNTIVPTHRDWYIESHRDHNINFFFAGGWRPSFVLDDINEDKIYLEKEATSYFFNNRDYHGVDAEPKFRYTLRVDGVFDDTICEKFNLIDGYVWRPEYDL